MEVNDMYDYVFKIVIIGDTGVGKSNLLSRYVSNRFKVDSQTTIGVEFQSKNIQLQIGNVQKTIRCTLWDTAGQERYRSITAAYYRGAVGALLVYDITRNDTFEKCEEWLQELRQHACDDVQVALIGNKADLRHLREVSFEDGQNLSQRTGTFFMETSAQNGQNVELCFETLVRNIIEQKDKMNNDDGADGPGSNADGPGGINIDNSNGQKKSGCC